VPYFLTELPLAEAPTGIQSGCRDDVCTLTVSLGRSRSVHRPTPWCLFSRSPHLVSSGRSSNTWQRFRFHR